MISPLKQLRLNESRLQNRKISTKEAAARLGISNRTYLFYESYRSIPEFITRAIDLGAFKNNDLLNEDLTPKVTRFGSEVVKWNSTIDSSQSLGNG